MTEIHHHGSVKNGNNSMYQDAIMKKFSLCLILFFIAVCLLITLAGCGDEGKNQSEIAVGNWTLFKNRAYTLLITNPKGEWNSSVRMTDVTSKVVKSKGNASGLWHIEAGQMIFTVTESDIEDVWEKNATLFFDIVELTETVMHLKNEDGNSSIWKQTSRQEASKVQEPLNPIVSMGPIAVNLNKNRSNDKDRYLCLNLNLIIKELMPEEAAPPLHPKAREAAMIFLSSLVFNDVKDFDRIKEQNKQLLKVINPYMEGVVQDIEVGHVIIATDIDKVEEFMIEHTLVEEPVPEEGEEGAENDKKS